MAISPTEENYLKAIFKLSGKDNETVATNAIALSMNTAAASVTDMLKRLTEKGYVLYEKYKGARLSKKGKDAAVQLLRKHRLWETFMVDKLNFSWDEVHEVAEQLEHIQSQKLIDRLDDFLGFPKFDPHGDPIPDKHGHFEHHNPAFLSEVLVGQQAIIVGVKEHSSPFLQYLQQYNLVLGTVVEVLSVFEYDQSLLVKIQNQTEHTITHKVAQNLYIKRP
ncbi:metal-dependent transcriptional regulator [Aureispira anguillae]|uniref:Transcriptional regulator MntR n=1 Tax=Aureispira anguillae TaxID=2864201 RepID=A0A915YM46_9BACT|nr:metal-dependent transcriptional regulator [Aureispira anguillae]BDS15303.1 metal-dependent transcriptional regulator [Aureispira anguillae]